MEFFKIKEIDSLNAQITDHIKRKLKTNPEAADSVLQKIMILLKTNPKQKKKFDYFLSISIACFDHLSGIETDKSISNILSRLVDLNMVIFNLI
jgi:hypothetical protein